MPTNQLADQSFESISPQEEKPTKEEGFFEFGRFKIKLKMIFILLGGSLGLLILLLFIVPRVLRPTQPPLPSPSPTPGLTPTEEETASPSAYATDSAILKIEQELNKIEEELKTTDLKETGLNPPVLDMNVELEE